MIFYYPLSSASSSLTPTNFTSSLNTSSLRSSCLAVPSSAFMVALVYLQIVTALWCAYSWPCLFMLLLKRSPTSSSLPPVFSVSKHHICGPTTIFYTSPFTPVDDLYDHSHLCPSDRIEKNKLYLSVTNVQIKTDLKTIDKEHTGQ